MSPESISERVQSLKRGILLIAFPMDTLPIVELLTELADIVSDLAAQGKQEGQG